MTTIRIDSKSNPSLLEVKSTANKRAQAIALKSCWAVFVQFRMADKSGVLDKCKVVNTFNETETRQATLINNQ